jgi:hypothetical protein
VKITDALSDLLSPTDPSVRLRTGTVSAIDGNFVTVALSGSTITYVPRLASYAPTVGDVVLLLQAGPQLLAIGRPA